MEEYYRGNPSPGSHRYHSPGRNLQSWDGITMPSAEINHRFARGHFDNTGFADLPPEDYFSEPMLAGPAAPSRNFSVFVSNVNARPKPAVRKDPIPHRSMLARPTDPRTHEVASLCRPICILRASSPPTQSELTAVLNPPESSR